MRCVRLSFLLTGLFLPSPGFFGAERGFGVSDFSILLPKPLQLVVTGSSSSVSCELPQLGQLLLCTHQ